MTSKGIQWLWRKYDEHRAEIKTLKRRNADLQLFVDSRKRLKDEVIDEVAKVIQALKGGAMICPQCNEAMKPLFTGAFCPNDCDRSKTLKAVGELFVWGAAGAEGHFGRRCYAPMTQYYPELRRFRVLGNYSYTTKKDAGGVLRATITSEDSSIELELVK
jgi:hypothetical protein